ncbi:fibroblast growth factor receptor 3-like [Protopterus annectens]|uniref:fibroblast growth factor receptor 3-like n=1 Tax=Protopterus annectens TaxID=7888 RepID=UPI001CFB7DB1|nr:fibroblast growth factor receptor 3-like [Protopterus annectens]
MVNSMLVNATGKYVSTQPTTTGTSNQSNNNLYITTAAIPFIILVVIVICVVHYKRKRKCQSITTNTKEEDYTENEDNIISRSCVQLEQLTLAPPQLPEKRFSQRRSKHSFQMSTFTVLDISLQELLKNGKRGCFYKAKLRRGNCKGHKLVTCKIIKNGVSWKKMQGEIFIMKKLGYHNNVLQLLDWNIVQEPHMLIMEYAGLGTLKTFLRTNRAQLSTNKNLQRLLALAAYYIGLGMEYIASKMIIHQDLALRNIMVIRFPQECKITEFGLARVVSNPMFRNSKKSTKSGVPLRWYPPEYFKSNTYSFPSDVWSYGILLWELQTLGCAPYPEMENVEAVVFGICSGYRMRKPSECREEIYRVMKWCWADIPEQRPSFSDIVRHLDTIVEDDNDYVRVFINEERYQMSHQTPTTNQASVLTASSAEG